MFGGKVEVNWLFGVKSIFYIGFDYCCISCSGECVWIIKCNMMIGEFFFQFMVFIDFIWQDVYINDVGAYVEYCFFISEWLSWNSGLWLDWVNVNSNVFVFGFMEQYGFFEV